ncbi:MULTISPECIES: DUF2635 domain-containing protein [unclassified Serratia (in: enterobacteria)]|uniref:DUF2635 domain-containing protein n=1 Tax=unclassified Serratia (in: enterobacteria) TaxID=2647522 RepID=UPI000502F970|nr:MULTISPECIES: DUF2635 domain-containing protein [unclassified Serratia (in: enterobacteria)]KFK95022.1 hypothetical protein IV04_21480 [Serratia sp. Ag1]KFK96687.1 hypothetical protein JV45_02895 [Serratia sp. Ag2]
MYVIPSNGRSVPDPVKGDFLPKEGRNVADTNYWHRRLASGEVVLKDAAPNQKPEEAESNEL